MARYAVLLAIVMLIGGCGSPPGLPSPTGLAASPTPAAVLRTPAPSPTPDAPVTPRTTATVTPEIRTPTPDPTPPVADMTAYERELLAVLREDVRRGSCGPRRTELPPGAVAGVECRLDTPLVERVAVYGFVTGDPNADADQTFEDRAVVAYLERMGEEGVLGEPGDCLGNTPEDVSWQGLEADQSGTDHYLQVEFNGRTYGIARYGCFRNEQGVANFRATCTSGTYIGVLGQAGELDELTEWALRWPNPDELAFSMPGICAGLQRDTY